MQQKAGFQARFLRYLWQVKKFLMKMKKVVDNREKVWSSNKAVREAAACQTGRKVNEKCQKSGKSS